MTTTQRRWLLVAITAMVSLSVVGCGVIAPSNTIRQPEIVDIGDRGDSARPTPATQQPPKDSGRIARDIAFDPKEYARLPTTGTATISGRLSMDIGGGTVIGANQGIAVAPITTYSAEAAAQALAGRTVERADPRAREYTHTTRTDANGRFRLTDLPPGDFYVSGTVVDPTTGQRRIVIKEARLRNGHLSEVKLHR